MVCAEILARPLAASAHSTIQGARQAVVRPVTGVAGDTCSQKAEPAIAAGPIAGTAVGLRKETHASAIAAKTDRGIGGLRAWLILQGLGAGLPNAEAGRNTTGIRTGTHRPNEAVRRNGLTGLVRATSQTSIGKKTGCLDRRIVTAEANADVVPPHRVDGAWHVPARGASAGRARTGGSGSLRPGGRTDELHRRCRARGERA
jgi:hypothetical protein